MKLVIDTNVIIDVFEKRDQFYESSRKVLELCQSGKIQGFITSKTLCDIFYLLHSYLHDKDMTYKACDNVLKIFKVLGVSSNDTYIAYEKRTTDFEDCLLAQCAISNKCNGIVTRNVKDFKNFDISVYTPEDIVDLKI